MTVDVIVDERTLREIYLPAFEIAVTRAQPWTVMSAYNRVNGTYCCEHQQLLQQILRAEWGFAGLVVSDWGANNDRVAAVRAGLDLEMPGGASAHDEVDAAALEPGIFSKLLLVDPVILSRAAYRSYAEREGDVEHFAARHRNEWPSPEALFASSKSRPPFSLLDPAVLHDYCQYGLVPSPDGDGCVLACPPRIEAATYGGSAGGDIYEEIGTIDIPVRILRARERTAQSPADMSSSPTNPELAKHFSNAEDVYLPQFSHFIPMEAPGFVADQLRAMAAGR